MPFANVNGARLYFEIQGEGEPLLLIPGLGLDHTYYRLGEPLLRRNLKTIGVDLRGIGQSQKDFVEYTAELWADDLAALIDELGLGSAHVLGSSLGGTIALAMGVRHPQKVSSLIIVGGFTELTRSVELNYSLRKKLIAKLGLGEELAEFMGLWIMTREFIESEAGSKVLEGMKENVKRNSPELYLRFLDSILRLGRREPGKIPPFTATLNTIKAPTLVMCADNDHFIPVVLSKIIVENVPGSKYVEIPGGGHIPFIEKPEESAAIVSEFMRSLREQPARQALEVRRSK